MELILKALRFAEKKHEGQTRKVSGAEYLTQLDKKLAQAVASSSMFKSG